jgi:hypothetical protein
VTRGRRSRTGGGSPEHQLLRGRWEASCSGGVPTTLPSAELPVFSRRSPPESAVKRLSATVAGHYQLFGTDYFAVLSDRGHNLHFKIDYRGHRWQDYAALLAWLDRTVKELAELRGRQATPEVKGKPGCRSEYGSLAKLLPPLLSGRKNDQAPQPGPLRDERTRNRRDAAPVCCRALVRALPSSAGQLTARDSHSGPPKPRL